jgi:hypothetical protein
MLGVPGSRAQEQRPQDGAVSPGSVVPHLIKYSGAIPNAPGTPAIVDIKFSLYTAQNGGDPLWSETQQVSLDAAGRYSVVLGSKTAAGLPDGVFANGQARWIGVTLGLDQESTRTVLLATPYSLKASDAETLGGHPAADFALKNAQSPTGTDITQINAGNGVTGGGTGPTVTLGLSSSYLQSLGNEVYPQLSGNNMLSGTNSFSAGKVTIGGSPALTVANISGSSPVTVTTSGSAVKIGLSDSALENLGNGIYAQLGAANTFNQGQTFKSAVTFASGQTFPGTVALSGNNTFTGSDAFSKPVAFASSQTFPGAGTITGVTAGTGLSGGGSSGSVTLNVNAAALESTYNSIYAGLSANNNFSGENTFTSSAAGNTPLTVNGTTLGILSKIQTLSASGVYFGGVTETIGIQADSSSFDGVGLVASADDGYGAIIGNNSPSSYFALYAESINPNAGPFQAYNNSNNSSCTINQAAFLSCTGGGGVVHSVSNHNVETYNMQSAENWIEDFGSGELVSGSAHISLEPTFAATVNTSDQYHIFLTPNGDCKGLYVANKTPDSFEVRELGGGRATVSFDYKVVAKRKGYEAVRMTDVTAQVNADKARRDKMHGIPITHPSPAGRPQPAISLPRQ